MSGCVSSGRTNEKTRLASCSAGLPYRYSRSLPTSLDRCSVDIGSCSERNLIPSGHSHWTLNKVTAERSLVVVWLVPTGNSYPLIFLQTLRFRSSMIRGTWKRRIRISFRKSSGHPGTQSIPHPPRQQQHHRRQLSARCSLSKTLQKQ